MAKIQRGKKKREREKEKFEISYLSRVHHEIYQHGKGMKEDVTRNQKASKNGNTNYFADHRLRCIDIIDNWGWNFKGRMASIVEGLNFQ